MGESLSYLHRRTVPALHLLRRGLAAVLVPALFWAQGCAEVTHPTPTVAEVEEAQLAATRRHPFKTWSLERASRVFLRLLGVIPQTHGRTYPFLGFDWWVTEGGKIVIDNVWQPSPAHDAGLRQGDIIVSLHNWPVYPWVAEFDRKIRAVREISRDLTWRSLPRPYGRRGQAGGLNLLTLPGELLVALMLDARHLAMEARGRYLCGPVDLVVARGEETFPLTLYPQHLPAEYAILVDTQDRKVNAYAAPGRVILSQRLVSLCLNDDELAVVLGHELAHQVLGHLVRGAGHRRLGGAAGQAWRLVGLFATRTINTLTDLRRDYWLREAPPSVVQDAVVSVFSRQDEREADIYGLWYAHQAGFDIERGLALWERLGTLLHDPFDTTEFLDSHPAPMERLARLKRTARYFKAGQAASIFLQAQDLDRQPPPE